tara:strand:+ start:1391 stop:1900 length:510 start_codon:yes stop_codon:yes gene_type:complete
MKELNKFRNFINEGKFEIGDKVTMKSGGGAMEIMKSRRMFGSNINAYTVKSSDGETNEYDESQLKLAESLLNESAPGYDTRKFGGALPTLESVKAAYEAKNDKEEVKEGVWNMPTMDEVIEFVGAVEELKEKFYNIVGSDAVFDGLDQAIIEAKNLVDPGNDDSYNSNN